MEVQLRGEVKNKLDNVQSVLLAALEKASKSLQDIKNDVKQGIVWKVGWLFRKLCCEFVFSENQCMRSEKKVIQFW